MSPPRGRIFPFPPKGSSDWLSSHVTYDQAVEMFFNQTATQQHIGISPLVCSMVFRGVKYATLQEAQQVHTSTMNAEYEAREQRDLADENRGSKASKTINDQIRNRIVPTENGLESPELYKKPFGEKCPSFSSFVKSLTGDSESETAQSNITTPKLTSPEQSAISERPLSTTSTQSLSTTQPQPIAIQEEKKEDETVFSLGWCQVEMTQSKDLMFESLFTDQTSNAQRTLIKQHNFHLNSMVRQGEIVVIPTMKAVTEKDKKDVSDLQEDAKAASVELAKLEPNEAATANRFFELFDYYLSQGMPSDNYAYASYSVGAIAEGVGRHLKNINGVLQEVNDLYVSQVAMSSRTGGMGMNYGSFVAERTALMSKLDGSLSMLSRRMLKIPTYTPIRKALNLSTKSVIHHADEIIKNGMVPNLGNRMAIIAKGMTNAEKVGYVGLALSAASGLSSINNACSVDGTGECGKTTTREVVGFLGGWGGGYAGANVGVILVLGVVGFVAGVGITVSAPVIAVATVGSAIVGGAIGGVGGTSGGKFIGDLIYEWVDDGAEDL